MTGREKLLKLAALFGAASKLERTTVSWRLFRDTSKLDDIVAGRDLYLGRYERAMQFFADHWPSEADSDWPNDIPRPAKTMASGKVNPSPEVEGAAA